MARHAHAWRGTPRHQAENILLEGGHAIVADFGVAKAITASADSEVSSAGMAIGTPTYMSPEQAAATPTLDGRADVYSLGCVVYEMLAGAPPFTGSTAQAVAARHAVDPVPPLRTVRSTVPKAVDEAITTALAKVPADRYSSAADFGRALQEAPRRAAAIGWWRSHWWGAAIGIGALALMLLLMRRSSSTSAGTAAVSPEPMRIAVLYLDDKTPDSSLRLFADGLTEELIHELSGLNGVLDPNGGT
jgi:serine/threonine-protein kinase